MMQQNQRYLLLCQNLTPTLPTMQLDHEQFAAGGHAHSSECILKLLGSSVDEERATEVSLNPLR